MALGLDWHDIELMEEDGKLPVDCVADLLEMLLDTEPRFPTAEEMVSCDMDADAGAWERTFQRKRRRLVWLFRTALKLEEDLASGYDPGFGCPRRRREPAGEGVDGRGGGTRVSRRCRDATTQPSLVPPSNLPPYWGVLRSV